MKHLLTLVSFMGIIIFTSCKNEKTAVVTEPEVVTDTVATAPAFEPFQVMAISHTVKDFDAWKKEYDAHESIRTAAGLTPMAVGRDLDNPKKVHVFNRISDLQKAMDFGASADLKAAMKKAGVTGTPEVIIADILRFEESPANVKDRVRIGHKVKDFDAWLKVYDAEGKDVRASHGLVDRSISRNHNDSSMVYVVFAVTDITKAKARMNDPALKKIMTDAGVEGMPTFTFYSVVD